MHKLSDYFRCVNYYAGESGRDLRNLDGSPLTDNDLKRLFIAEINEIYVSPLLIPKLVMVKEAFRTHNIGLVIKDGFRSLELYKMIIEMRRRKGQQVEGIISTDRFPHATGLAVDVTLFDLRTGKDIWNRDEVKDGQGSRFLNFYQSATDEIGRNFHRIQTLMKEIFGRSDMVAGQLNEVWHWELSGINEKTPRY